MPLDETTPEPYKTEQANLPNAAEIYLQLSSDESVDNRLKVLLDRLEKAVVTIERLATKPPTAVKPPA